jgi:RimJ/RimL family protein N-acetyltransferase
MDEAASHHDGYRIATYSELPDELLASTCDVENQTAVDAPTGDIEFEAQGRTPEIRKRTFARDRESGVQTMETVAIADDRDVVAVTTLRIPEDDSGVMFQGTTIVAREHRGHRLGLAIKAANLQAAQRAFPGRKAVHTSNRETNASMVSINERLGFRPVELHVQFMREVDDASRV